MTDQQPEMKVGDWVRIRCDAPVPDLLQGEMGTIVSELWEGQSGQWWIDVALVGGLRESVPEGTLEPWAKPYEPCQP